LAFDANKNKEETKAFYNTLQKEVDKISDGERTLEDLNARVKNTIVNGAMQKFNEP